MAKQRLAEPATRVTGRPAGRQPPLPRRLGWPGSPPPNEPLAPAVPPYLLVQAVEVLDGPRLVRTAPHPPLPGHLPEVPAQLATLHHAGAEPAPAHAVVQRGLPLTPAGDQL